MLTMERSGSYCINISTISILSIKKLQHFLEIVLSGNKSLFKVTQLRRKGGNGRKQVSPPSPITF